MQLKPSSFPPALAVLLMIGLTAGSLGSDPVVSPYKKTDVLKTVLDPDAEVVEHAPSSAHAGVTLRDFLAARLGNRFFHPRAHWAGRSGRYEPITQPPRVWRPIGTVRYLTIHHAAGIPIEHPAKMIRNIYTGHVSSSGPLGGAADVGYHFFVDRNGEIWEARDVAKIGSHVGSTPPGLNNEGNIGICGLGDFAREGPPRAMIERIAELCGLIAEYYGRRLTVRGHRDWTGINRFAVNKKVDCPGRLQAAVAQARQVIAQTDALAREREVAAGVVSDLTRLNRQARSFNP